MAKKIVQKIIDKVITPKVVKPKKIEATKKVSVPKKVDEYFYGKKVVSQKEVIINDKKYIEKTTEGGTTYLV